MTDRIKRPGGKILRVLAFLFPFGEIGQGDKYQDHHYAYGLQGGEGVP